MKFIKNLKISVKLLGSFGILIAALIIIGVLSINSMQTLNEHSQELYDENLKATEFILEVKSNLNYSTSVINRMLNQNLAHEIEANITLLSTLADSTGEFAALYAQAVQNDPDALEHFETFRGMLTQFRDMREVVIELLKADDYRGAQAANEANLRPMIEILRRHIDVMVDHEAKTASEMIADSIETYEESRRATLIIIIVIVIIAVALGLVISFTISGDLKKTCIAAEHLADGDLTINIPENFRKQKDELGNLARSFQKMRDSFYETVSNIKVSSDVLDHSVTDVNSTLGELNNRITDTSAATEELSAGMEETGASSEEMNATAAEIERAVESVAEKAGDGAAKSGEIQSRATDLGKNVNNSISKSNNVFNEIKASLEKALEDSKAVDEINTLADAILGITSQTTLLALNASIEAARAGEAGRGFAVVANEISALADNSKNTVTQIQAITKVVMAAVNALAGSSTELLNFVSSDVMKDYHDMLGAAESYTNDAVFISDMTSDLSATSEELLASIQVMIRAINEVAAAAQEGARTTSIVAEQTSDISNNAQSIVGSMQETKDTAMQLSDIVAKFKL